MSDTGLITPSSDLPPTDPPLRIEQTAWPPEPLRTDNTHVVTSTNVNKNENTLKGDPDAIAAAKAQAQAHVMLAAGRSNRDLLTELVLAEMARSRNVNKTSITCLDEALKVLDGINARYPLPPAAG